MNHIPYLLNPDHPKYHDHLAALEAAERKTRHRRRFASGIQIASIALAATCLSSPQGQAAIEAGYQAIVKVVQSPQLEWATRPLREIANNLPGNNPILAPDQIVPLRSIFEESNPNPVSSAS